MSERRRAIEDMFLAVPDWADNIILAGIRGSDAHGTKLPPGHPHSTDDIDTFGVSVQTPGWYMGLRGLGKARSQWATDGDHYDHLVYDLRKFVGLLAKGNPNVMGYLWSEPDDLLHVAEAGGYLIKMREDFLSRRCFDALAGYAVSQMKKMEGGAYRGYMGTKRKLLVHEIGYDVKHAAHCVRLLGMGIDLAEKGVIVVRRPEKEAEFLRSIKAGNESYDDVMAATNDLWDKFRAAEKKSDLRREPDPAWVDVILRETIFLANTKGGGQ